MFCNIMSKCIDSILIGNFRLDDFVVSCQTTNSCNNNDQITVSANLNSTDYVFKQKKILFSPCLEQILVSIID